MTPYQIIALGDSITYGYPFGPKYSWVTQLSQALGQKILNQGVNGDCLADLDKRLNRDVLDLAPQHCLILGGTNDLYQQVPYEKMKATYLKIIKKLQNEKIQAWIGLPPPIRDKKLSSQLKTFYNWLVRLSQKEKIPRVDFYQALTHKGSGRLKAEVLEDEAHPSALGYQLMGQAATKAFLKASGSF